MIRLPARLHEVLAAVCPIEGVSIASVAAKSATIKFRDEATAGERAAANSALAAFDWSQTAQDAWEANQNIDRKNLRDAAAGAISTNQTFLADANVTNAELVAQVRALTQQVNSIIKRVIQID